MVENAVDSVMKQTVPNESFVNISGFGVRDFEGLIGAMGVGFGLEVEMQRNNITH